MSRREYNEMLPDFLGIGAQRAGTSWLHSNLSRHPDVWMPPLKEIHYFDRFYPDSPSLLAAGSLFTRIFSRKRCGRQWRDALWRYARKSIRASSWQGFRWHLKYFFGRYDDRWYASLFSQAEGRVKGEITPAYSILEPGDIELVREMMPEAKIIYVIRNPIDRAWSAIRYMKWPERTGMSLEACSLADLKRIAEREGFRSRGDYVTTIANWETVFQDQFFVGFYDDIAQQPTEFLLRIYEFLQVESSREYLSQLMSRRINPAPQREMPPAFRLYLTERYHAQLKTLSEMFGGHADRWLEAAENSLEGQRTLSSTFHGAGEATRSSDRQ